MPPPLGAGLGPSANNLGGNDNISVAYLEIKEESGGESDNEGAEN